MTISFMVYANHAATYSVGVRNNIAAGSANSEYRGFFRTYTTTANGWKKVTATIPGATSGNWGTGFSLFFCVGAGSTFSTTEGAWNTGNSVGVTGISALTTKDNFLYIAEVQAQAGTVATTFEPEDYADQLWRCMRTLQVYSVVVGPDWANGANQTQGTFPFMRAVPSATLASATGGTVTAFSSNGWRAATNAANFGGATLYLDAEM
jgi:hypothetical protein